MHILFNIAVWSIYQIPFAVLKVLFTFTGLHLLKMREHFQILFHLTLVIRHIVLFFFLFLLKLCLCCWYRPLKLLYVLIICKNFAFYIVLIVLLHFRQLQLFLFSIHLMIMFILASRRIRGSSTLDYLLDRAVLFLTFFRNLLQLFQSRWYFEIILFAIFSLSISLHSLIWLHIFFYGV
jgi:hypothetical protein